MLDIERLCQFYSPSNLKKLQSLKPRPATGSLGDYTAYKMRGVDKIIIRKKGGPSKKQIKTSPSFDKLRRVNVEFSGRSRGTKWIMRMIRPQKALADYNIAGHLNALLKPIQALDVVSEFGKRNVALSKNPKLLEGFSLNRQATFDTILRSQLKYSISKENLSAQIDLPELLPGINFYSPNKHPMFSIVAVLGVIPDLIYTSEMGYSPATKGYDEIFPEVLNSSWFPTLKGSPATTLQMKLQNPLPDDACSLILSVGIRFGTMQDAMTVQQVKYAGAARVLAVV